MTRTGRAAVAVAVVVGVGVGAVVVARSGDDGDASESSPSERIAVPQPFKVAELSSPPFGDWDRYNVVSLIDGSGFVIGGAGDRVELFGDAARGTLDSALFDFATGTYTTLPKLPVEAGLGLASGARVGTTITVVGQDCPAGPGYSAVGVEFCAVGGVGAKVLLTWTEGEEAWERHDLPDPLLDFDASSPSVFAVDRVDGAVDGEPDAVWIVSRPMGRDRRAARFVPETGEFGPTIDVPESAEQLCQFGGSLNAFGSFDGSPARLGTKPTTNLRWVWDGSSWQSAPPLVDAPAARNLCTPSGVFTLVPKAIGESFVPVYDAAFVTAEGHVTTMDFVWGGQELFGDPMQALRVYSDTPVVPMAAGNLDDLGTEPATTAASGWSVMSSSGIRNLTVDEVSNWTGVHSLGSVAIVETNDASKQRSKYELSLFGLPE